MLMTIRDKAQGWIAWAIVILISIPFALWGIQEYLGVGSEPVIAKVNDREITEREVESASVRLRNELRQQLGAQYDADLFQESMLRKQVLDGLVRDTLISQAANDLGLKAGDLMIKQTILSIPAFQVNGRFDQEAYKRSVQLQGLTEKGFEERLRNSLVTRQLEMAIQGSAFTTRPFALQAETLGNQQRKIAYTILSSLNSGEIAEPSEQQVKQYYEKNRSRFMSDERVKLEYILLNLETISSTLSASADDLSAYFNEHKAEFVIPDKKRLSHILLEIDEDAAADDVDRIAQQARDILDKIEQGEAFEELARSVSQDIASATDGGDIGYLEPGIFDKAFEAAASELGLNQVSQPVRTRFGFHLIKVTELIKGDEGNFDAVKDEVKKRYLQTEAEQMFYDYAERLGNQVYEVPDALQPAADELDLPLQKSDWITRAGGEGIFSSAKVTAAAFTEEALTQGYNSEPLELSPNEIMVLRVTDHQESTLKALAEVKQEIIKSLKRQAAFTAIKNKADNMLTLLGEGKTLSSVADQMGLTVNEPGYISRVSNELPDTLLKAVFDMPRPSTGQSSHLSTVINDSEVAVSVLLEVKDGEPGKQVQQLIPMLSKQQGSDDFELYIESLHQKADIEYIKQ